MHAKTLFSIENLTVRTVQISAQNLITRYNAIVLLCTRRMFIENVNASVRQFETSWFYGE